MPTDFRTATAQPTLHIVLDRPRIAGNIGAIVRLAAGTGSALHVCGETPFDVDDKRMRRAGLDYWSLAEVHFHRTTARCLEFLGRPTWVVEVGGHKTPWDVDLAPGDVVVLGPEDGSVELDWIAPERILTLPLMTGARSLNVAQCTAVVAFEAVRQQGRNVLSSSVD